MFVVVGLEVREARSEACLEMWWRESARVLGVVFGVEVRVMCASIEALREACRERRAVISGADMMNNCDGLGWNGCAQ